MKFDLVSLWNIGRGMGQAPITGGSSGELDFRVGPDGALGRGRGMPPIGEFVVAL